jgi:hypothetical protein
MDADPRIGIRQFAGNQFKEAAGARLLFFEPAPPGIKKGWFDLGCPTISGNAYATCHLVLYDAAPMDTPFYRGHRLPPHDEYFSFAGSIHQNRTAEKMGSSDDYQAINRGYNGRFILFPELIEMLYKSVADHSEEKVINTFAAYDCIVIDEIGYVEIEAVQAGLFFTLMHKRHKKKTTLITSNLGFEQWASFLKNDNLTVALIDRLTENSHVINMKSCISLRPKLDQR